MGTTAGGGVLSDGHGQAAVRKYAQVTSRARAGSASPLVVVQPDLLAHRCLGGHLSAELAALGAPRVPFALIHSRKMPCLICAVHSPPSLCTAPLYAVRRVLGRRIPRTERGLVYCPKGAKGTQCLIRSLSCRRSAVSCRDPERILCNPL